MQDQNPLMKMLGSSRYFARMTFAANRKHYAAALKVKLEIFDGRNCDAVYNCNNIADVAQKLMVIYKDKIGQDLEERRLARWMIEYFEFAKITPPDFNKLLDDFKSTPQEVDARMGRQSNYEEDEEI
ncbi:MAG: hypothetical protein ACFFDW_02555 [Candidatus Thorarchaeota archaeon]